MQPNPIDLTNTHRSGPTQYLLHKAKRAYIEDAETRNVLWVRINRLYLTEQQNAEHAVSGEILHPVGVKTPEGEVIPLPIEPPKSQPEGLHAFRRIYATGHGERDSCLDLDPQNAVCQLVKDRLAAYIDIALFALTSHHSARRARYASRSRRQPR